MFIVTGETTRIANAAAGDQMQATCMKGNHFTTVTIMLTVWCFKTLAPLLKSCRDSGKTIMKSSVQEAPYSQELNSGFLS